MDARFTTLKRILDLFSQHERLSPAEIMSFSWLQKTVVHKYLAQLLREEKIQKFGKVPHVYYSIPWNVIKSHQIEKQISSYNSDYKTRKLVDDIFYKFSPTGKKQIWFIGMQQWSNERNLDIEKKIEDYIKIHNYIESQLDDCGMLHADEAFGKDFEKKHLDKVLYADQYKYMDFGRGKLAEMTFYAKTSQNKELIAENLGEILPKLECLIAREDFDAIAVTPWSIERKNQLLWSLKKELFVFGLPFVNVIKYYADSIAIPQKSLKTRSQRIENARNTIFIDDKNIKNYKKVLLIDDFVGSGATLNETAKKLKDEWIKQVYGFAFVGNTNLSYEVINEI